MNASAFEGDLEERGKGPARPQYKQPRSDADSVSLHSVNSPVFYTGQIEI